MPLPSSPACWEMDFVHDGSVDRPHLLPLAKLLGLPEDSPERIQPYRPFPPVWGIWYQYRCFWWGEGSLRHVSHQAPWSLRSVEMYRQMEGSQERLLLRRASAVLWNGLDWFQGLPLANTCYFSTENRSRLAFQASFNLRSSGFHRYQSYRKLKCSFSHMFPFKQSQGRFLFLNIWSLFS